jgi:hypothetical protein
MAIKPDHMAAFVANGEQGGPKPRREEINPGGKKGRVEIPDDDDGDGLEDDEEDDDEEDDDEGDDEGDDDDTEEGGEGKFGALIPLLEEFADEIVDAASNLPPDAVEDPTFTIEPEDSEVLADDLAGMPKQLTKALRECAQQGVSWDDAMKLGDHLEAEGITDDPELIAGWVFRAAQALE